MSYLRVTIAQRALTAAAAIAIVMWPVAPAHADGQDKSVIGQWKLTRVLDSSDISAIDDDKAQRLVGKTFSIASDKVQFGDRTCTEPDFEVTVAERDRFFQTQAHVSAAKLGLPDPVTAVHVNCTYVYKKAPDKLVVHWKGYFFDAVRRK
jgi:hypothetical protein